MSEFERSEIIYEEGWRGKKPVAGEADAQGESAPAEVPSAPPSKPLLISIQLILCAVAALALFILKAMDSPAYHGFMTRYRTQMNRPLISREFFEGSASPLSASADEVSVEASADELPPR